MNAAEVWFLIALIVAAVSAVIQALEPRLNPYHPLGRALSAAALACAAAGLWVWA